jgi:hypothetical protein
MRNDLERERDVPRRRSEATLTMGIEEEFFIVEQETGRLAHGGWQGLADDLLGSVDVTPEIYREMIEARTRVHVALQPLLDEQQFNRRTLVTHLRPHSKCLLACGTHPLDSWQNTTIEDKERYRQLIGGYGTCLERALTCGMHVHFGFNEPALMMAAYAFIRAYLPVLRRYRPLRHSGKDGIRGCKAIAAPSLTRCPDPAYLRVSQAWQNTRSSAKPSKIRDI